ncbi:unnamed protein product, partial [marine sediment metagenome]
NQEELLKVMGDSIEEGRRNIRDLKGSLDISQDEFDKRFYDLNRAEQQIKEMIQKPGVTEERIEEKAKEIVEEIGYRIEGEYLKVHLDRAKDFIHSLLLFH